MAEALALLRKQLAAFNVACRAYLHARLPMTIIGQWVGSTPQPMLHVNVADGASQTPLWAREATVKVMFNFPGCPSLPPVVLKLVVPRDRLSCGWPVQLQTAPACIGTVKTCVERPGCRPSVWTSGDVTINGRL